MDSKAPAEGRELPQPEQGSDGRTGDNLIELLARNEPALSKLITTVVQTWTKARESKARFSVRMGILVAVLVSLIVVTAAILTYLDKIDGAALTFLLGLIVGYMLTFVREAIQPTRD